jgi:hypothetical protein
LRTKDGVEADLVIDRPGNTTALVEIKSSARISERDVQSLARLAQDLPNSSAYCISLDPTPKKILGVQCSAWHEALPMLGLRT